MNSQVMGWKVLFFFFTRTSLVTDDTHTFRSSSAPPASLCPTFTPSPDSLPPPPPDLQCGEAAGHAGVPAGVF